MLQPNVGVRVAISKLPSADSKRCELRDWLHPTERRKHTEDMHSAVLRLHRTMRAQSFEQTAKTAHWLISSAVILGFPNLVVALRKVEQGAIKGSIAELGDTLLLDSIESVFCNATKMEVAAPDLPAGFSK